VGIAYEAEFGESQYESMVADDPLNSPIARILSSGENAALSIDNSSSSSSYNSNGISAETSEFLVGLRVMYVVGSTVDIPGGFVIAHKTGTGEYKNDSVMDAQISPQIKAGDILRSKKFKFAVGGYLNYKDDASSLLQRQIFAPLDDPSSKFSVKVLPIPQVLKATPDDGLKAANTSALKEIQVDAQTTKRPDILTYPLEVDFLPLQLLQADIIKSPI